MVKAYYWAPLLILMVVLICVVMGVQFDMPVGMSLLSVFLAFIFSFLAIQCTGITDITPLTAASKASQVVLGGATKGEGWATVEAQRLNLLGGALANMGANQASDLVGDFRVGFLLRTPPDQQWLAQGLGTIVACFLAPALFILFAKAYPCILDTEAETCAFSAPSVAAWRAVATAVTAEEFPVPNSSGIFAIAISLFGGAATIFREVAYTGKWAKYRAYHPNFMVIGLSFTLIQTYYGTALCIGAIPSYFWAKRNPKSFDIYGESDQKLRCGYVTNNITLRLCYCRWSHCRRGYWWRGQCSLPDRRHFWTRDVWLQHRLSRGFVLSKESRAVWCPRSVGRRQVCGADSSSGRRNDRECTNLIALSHLRISSEILQDLLGSNLQQMHRKFVTQFQRLLLILHSRTPS